MDMFEISFEGNTGGLPGMASGIDERTAGQLHAELPADQHVTLSGHRIRVSYTSGPADAEDRGYAILRVVRGALGIHFGEPLEVHNVEIRDGNGVLLDTTPTGTWSIGWADVSAAELGQGFQFLSHLDPDGPYARALDYYNQGRLLLRKNGIPEAAVVFYYKVLEALVPRAGSDDARRHAWLALGFSPDDCDRLERLRAYRHSWDAAHAATPYEPNRVRLRHAYEAEATAEMILVRSGSRFGVEPQPPRRQIHMRGRG